MAVGATVEARERFGTEDSQKNLVDAMDGLDAGVATPSALHACSVTGDQSISLRATVHLFSTHFI